MAKIVMTWMPTFFVGEDETTRECFAVRAEYFGVDPNGSELILPTKTLEEILSERHPEAQTFYIQEIRSEADGRKIIRYVAV